LRNDPSCDPSLCGACFKETHGADPELLNRVKKLEEYNRELKDMIPLVSYEDAIALAKKWYFRVKGVELEMVQTNEENQRLKIQNRRLMRKRRTQ
jgi:hypothetical protein